MSNMRSYHGTPTHRRLVLLLAFMLVAIPLLLLTRSVRANQLGRLRASSSAALQTAVSTPMLLGNQTTEPYHDTSSGSASEAFGFTATSSGTATTANVYLDSTDGATAGLYSSSSRRPGTLLDKGSVSSNTAGWTTIALKGGVQVTAGVRYWIAVGSTGAYGATVTYRDLNNAGTNLDFSGTGFSSPYQTNGQWQSNPISAYIGGGQAALPPSNTSVPTISGTAQVGDTLTASTGGWNASQPITYSYLWSDGTTGSTDKLPAADVGKMITVKVTATDSAGSASATSAGMGPVTSGSSPPIAPANSGLPTISGTAQQAQVLTGTNGTWTGTAPITYAYQWQDDGTASISGATRGSYTVQESDVGHTLDLVVTATNSAGHATATSAKSSVVTSSGGGGGGSVPCALTHAAGAAGTSSCWATHTGVQGATGYSEAQIKAGASGFTHVNSDVTVNTAGTTIDHEWISGCVAVNANNVTISNSLITPPDGDYCSGGGGGSQVSAINDGNHASSPTGLLIEDTTVDGGNSTGDQYGVSIIHGSCIRCNVFGFAKNYWSGTNTAAAPTVFQDDYSHDLSIHSYTGTTPPLPTCAHDNGWFIDSANNVTIEHSYSILTGAGYCVTGAITALADYGLPHDITVDSSYMEGINGADLYTGSPHACGTPNIVITNNAFSSDNGFSSTDYVLQWSPAGNVWSGNTIAETGAAFDNPPVEC